MEGRSDPRSARRRGGAPAAALIVTLAGAPFLGCGGASREGTQPAPKAFPSPIFDDLSLGMTREEVSRVRPVRPMRTRSGRSRGIWIYDSPDGHTAELTFGDEGGVPRLERIDVHFGRSAAAPEEYIARFERRLGAPDVRRRKAGINAYGDHRHEQYDTIWSDDSQYVYLTERVPKGGGGRPAYYLTVKNKEITATGPPTGYVPPPPPEGEEEDEPLF